MSNYGPVDPSPAALTRGFPPEVMFESDIRLVLHAKSGARAWALVEGLGVAIGELDGRRYVLRGALFAALRARTVSATEPDLRVVPTTKRGPS